MSSEIDVGTSKASESVPNPEESPRGSTQTCRTASGQSLSI